MSSNVDEEQATEEKAVLVLPTAEKRDRSKPDWATWNRRPRIRVREAVALAKNINPKRLNSLIQKNDRRCKNYAARLKTVIRNLGIDGPLKPALGHQINENDPGSTMVYLADFVVFYNLLGFRLPAEMKKLTPPRPASELTPSQSEESNSLPPISKRKQPANGDVHARTKHMYTMFLRTIFSTLIEGSMDRTSKMKERVSTIRIFFEFSGAKKNELPSDQTLTKILGEIDVL